MAWETVFIFWKNPLNIVRSKSTGDLFQSYRTTAFCSWNYPLESLKTLHVPCKWDVVPGSKILKATTCEGGCCSTKINHACSKNVNTVSNSCQVLFLFHPLSFILLTPDRWQDVSFGIWPKGTQYINICRNDDLTFFTLHTGIKGVFREVEMTYH